jgi:hypothetical protein
LILVDLGAWPTYPTIFPIANQISENPYVFSEVEIARKQIALQRISTRTLRLLSPKGIVKSLVTLANLTTDRQVPVVLAIERYVFERIPEVVATGRIAKVTEIVIISCV